MGCNEIFAKRIKELREEKGLSMRRLASDLNIGHNTISQYESCQRTPDIETCKLFADYFNVSCDYLVGLSDTKERRK